MGELLVGKALLDVDRFEAPRRARPRARRSARQRAASTLVPAADGDRVCADRARPARRGRRARGAALEIARLSALAAIHRPRRYRDDACRTAQRRPRARLAAAEGMAGDQRGTASACRGSAPRVVRRGAARPPASRSGRAARSWPSPAGPELPTHGGTAPRARLRGAWRAPLSRSVTRCRRCDGRSARRRTRRSCGWAPRPLPRSAQARTRRWRGDADAAADAARPPDRARAGPLDAARARLLAGRLAERPDAPPAPPARPRRARRVRRPPTTATRPRTSCARSAATSPSRAAPAGRRTRSARLSERESPGRRSSSTTG